MGKAWWTSTIVVYFLFSSLIYGDSVDLDARYKKPVLPVGQHYQISNDDLVLRALDISRDSVEDVEQIAMDKETASFLHLGSTQKDVSATIELLQRPILIRSGTIEANWIVSSRSRYNRIVGFFSVGEVDGTFRQFLISYAIHPHFRRQGLGRQMVGLVRDWLLARMDHGDQILAVVDEQNRPSRNLLGTLGIHEAEVSSGNCVHILER